MQRITQKNLNTLCSALNKLTNNPTEYGYGHGNGANVGHFYAGQLFGTFWALGQVSNENGATRSVLNAKT